MSMCVVECSSRTIWWWHQLIVWTLLGQILLLSSAWRDWRMTDQLLECRYSEFHKGNSWMFITSRRDMLASVFSIVQLCEKSPWPCDQITYAHAHIRLMSILEIATYHNNQFWNAECSIHSCLLLNFLNPNSDISTCLHEMGALGFHATLIRNFPWVPSFRNISVVDELVMTVITSEAKEHVFSKHLRINLLQGKWDALH